MLLDARLGVFWQPEGACGDFEVLLIWGVTCRNFPKLGASSSLFGVCYISFCTKFTQEKGVVGGGEGGELFWETCAKNT